MEAEGPELVEGPLDLEYAVDSGAYCEADEPEVPDETVEGPPKFDEVEGPLLYAAEEGEEVALGGSDFGF